MKIIVKHMTGSKANQIDIFELPIKEIIFGRETVCQVVYDSVNDNQVSRRHIKITQFDKNKFFLIDLFSKNGTFVNHQAISIPVSLQVGDIVQLGNGGPKFEFDLESPSRNSDKAIRSESSIPTQFPTRVISTD